MAQAVIVPRRKFVNKTRLRHAMVTQMNLHVGYETSFLTAYKLRNVFNIKPSDYERGFLPILTYALYLEKCSGIFHTIISCLSGYCCLLNVL